MSLDIKQYFNVYNNNKTFLIEDKIYAKSCLLVLNKSYDAFNIYSMNISDIAELSQILNCMITEINDIENKSIIYMISFKRTLINEKLIELKKHNYITFSYLI
jgi:hypothetical protein